MLRKYYFVPLIVLFLIGLILGSFYDYQISEAIFQSKEPFGTFLAAFGEWPFYSLITFLSAFLIVYAFKFFKNSNKKLMAHNIGCGIIGIVAGGYFQGNAITNANGYNMQGGMKILFFIIGFLLMIPGILLGIYAAKKNNEVKYWRLAFYLLFALTVSILIVTIYKEIAHRPRFRLLVVEPSLTFHNWWQHLDNYKECLNLAVAEEFKSFPSGHAVSAVSLIALPYVPRLFDGKIHCKTPICLAIFAFLYIVLLCFSRMWLGAHFLSDISMGGLITSIVFTAFMVVIDKFKILD